MMNFITDFLTHNFVSLIVASIILLIGLFVFSLINHRIKGEMQPKSLFLKSLVSLLGSSKIKQFLLFSIFYTCLLALPLPQIADHFLKIIGIIFFSSCIALLIQEGIKLLFHIYIFKTEENNLRIKGYKSILTLVIVIIWSLYVVFLLDNLGLKISSVIAGFGIGGVAIALASQTFLGDLFSYFAIIFDHPFNVGDFIIVDNYMGTVEMIGIKTTA